MGYRKMTLDKLIQTIIQATNSSNSKNFCFFLGSGASKTSGIRTGRELVEEWDKEIRGWGEEEYQSWCKEKGITPENRTSFYSAYYDKRYGLEEDEGYDFIERTMEAGRPNAGYMMLAQILTQTPHRVVITTNFDHLTETAVDRYADRMPLVIGHEHLAKFVKAPATRPTIIKIHRDMLLEPISESDGLQELAQVWKDALEKLFKEYHPVFLGYSGGDKNVMEFLQENAGRFNNKDLKMPYWTFYGKDFSSAEVKAFMDKVQGFCIFECDFDAFMVRLADAFGLDFPDVEKILGEEKADCGKAKAKMEEIRKSVKRAEAKKLVDKADGLDWDDGKQRKEIEQLLRDAIHIEPEYAYAHRRLGDLLDDLSRKTEAEAEYRKAIRLNPNDATAHYNLGGVLYNLDRKTEAEAEYREAIRLDPDYADAHYELGRLLDVQHQTDKAEAEYREAVFHDPKNARAHYYLGCLLDKTEQPEEAEKEYIEAIRLNPRYTEAHSALIHLWTKTSRRTMTEEACLEVICSNPESAYAYCNLGLLFANTGREKEAEIAYQKAIGIAPEYATAYYNLGLLFANTGRGGEAVDAYRKAICLDPQSPEPYNSLAILLANGKEMIEAEKGFREAIRLSPNNAEYHYNLGNLLGETKRWDAAKTAYQEAIRLNPNNADYHYNLAIILERLKYHEEAAAERKIAASLRKNQG